VRTGPPEAELPCFRAERERVQEPRVPSSLALVEVGRGGTDRDEADIHVHSVADADDVAQQPPVPVDAIGYGLREQAYPCAGGSSVFVRSDAALP
jgi:hypothetical protein